MKIRKAHILSRHFYNVEDDSAGILFTEENGGVDWLWDVIQYTVGLFGGYLGKVNYYDGCNWLFIFGMMDLVGSFLVI
jgi:hypothetical protein